MDLFGQFLLKSYLVHKTQFLLFLPQNKPKKKPPKHLSISKKLMLLYKKKIDSVKNFFFNRKICSMKTNSELYHFLFCLDPCNK